MKKAILLAAVLLLAVTSASAQVGYYSADGASAPAESTPDDVIDMSAESQSGGEQQPPEAYLVPKTTQVTSLQKCLDKLPPEDAAEVRLNPIRPYQECLARLSNAAAEKRSINVSREKEDKEPVAENARNFSRVREEDGNKKADAAAREAEANSGHWSSKAVKNDSARAPIEPEGEPGGLPEESDGDSSYDDSSAKPARKKTGFSRFIPEIKPDKSKASFND